MKIGLLLIATGKYDVFLQPLIDSVDKYFFRGDEITIYLFTDKTLELLHSDRINVVVIPTEHKPFPYATLYRYKYFTQAADKIDSEYLFYCDVDMLFVDEVGREILPEKYSLVATIHPGFYKGGGSWCTDENSNAYTKPEYRRKYYAGGFNGGKAKEFLLMSKILSEEIDEDEKNGVMAEWHDEAFLNLWFGIHKCKELSPSYCYPERWTLPFPKKLLALDKNHKEIRS